MCPVDFVALEPYEPAAAAAEPEAEPDEAVAPPSPPPDALRWDRSRCWNCGTVPPDSSNTECLNPECRRALTPPALLIRFQYGDVEVNPGAQAELGRKGDHSTVFRSFPNVSRRHAVVGVDPDGAAWILPLPAPNGTFLDEAEIEPSLRQPLRNGQRVRFALHAEGTTSIFTR